MKTPIALARCTQYDSTQVHEAVKRTVDLLGGIEGIISRRSKVLIKPNLLSDLRPDECVTTHPSVVEAIILLLKQIDADIYLGDSPSSVGQKRATDRVYEVTGMKEVCDRHGVTLVYFDNAAMKNGLPITEWIQQCDYMINVPKFKTHTLTMLTGAVKNMFGCVTGIHKAKLHQVYLDMFNFSKRVVDVFEATQPSLTIVDAVTALSGDGPATAGIKTNTEFIVAGRDAVAVDSILAVMMGLTPHDIATTKNAALRRLGETDLGNIEIRGEAISTLRRDDFKLPSISRIYTLPKIVRDFAKQFMWYKMVVIRENCRSCGRCLEACPVNTIRYEEKKAYIDSSKCILCSCCQEVCPHNAVSMKKSLLLRAAGV